MAHYVKLFDSIIHSTIWQEDLHVKVVWVTMLALTDANGEVMASIPGLAKAAGVSIPQCEEALEKFMAPDRYSRSSEDEGRRITKIDGGWELVNYRKYRELKSMEQEREKAAERQRRFRDRQRSVTNPVTLVTKNDAQSCSLRQEEEEEEEEQKKKKKEKTKELAPRKAAPVKAVVSLEEILQGGKGTTFWEAYWKLVALFGPAKNPAPKTTAALYMTATVGFHPDHIQEKAEVLCKSTSNRQYLPQLAKWLEGGGYLNPNPTPHTGGQNGSRSPQHRAAVDAAYTDSLGSRPAPTGSIGDDPEMLGLFGATSDGPDGAQAG